MTDTDRKKRQVYLSRSFQLPVEEYRDYDDYFSYTSSNDVWTSYIGILGLAQLGDFNQLPKLRNIMRQSSDYFIWRAACELAGYAGSWDFIRPFVQSFETEFSDRGVQYCLAITLGASCNIEASPFLLKLHQAADDEEQRHQIEDHLSYLLEEEDGPVGEGAAQSVEVPEDIDAPLILRVDRDSYFESVRAAVREMQPTQVGGPTPIYEGKVVDVALQARRLHKRLLDGEPDYGRVYRERAAFEAATGIDTRPFYNENGALQRLAAIAILEEFLDSADSEKLRPGQRYFFGHPIPL